MHYSQQAAGNNGIETIAKKYVNKERDSVTLLFCINIRVIFFLHSTAVLYPGTRKLYSRGQSSMITNRIMIIGIAMFFHMNDRMKKIRKP